MQENTSFNYFVSFFLSFFSLSDILNKKQLGFGQIADYLQLKLVREQGT